MLLNPATKLNLNIIIHHGNFSQIDFINKKNKTHLSYKKSQLERHLSHKNTKKHISNNLPRLIDIKQRTKPQWYKYITISLPTSTEDQDEAPDKPFTPDGFHKALMLVRSNKAPGPDGFPAEFFFFLDILGKPSFPIFFFFLIKQELIETRGCTDWSTSH